MSAPASPAVEKPKSKLKPILIGSLLFVLLTAAGAGGAWFYFSGRQSHSAEAAHEPVAAEPKPRAAPTYLALETMVVNLADPGGERVAQIGITLDLDNDKTVGQVKTLLPAIRSRVLLLASQRSSDELLKRDGKEKLADDIAQEVTLALGYEVDEPRPAPKKAANAKAGAEDGDADEAPVRRRSSNKRRAPPSPVYGVLFTSFIVQ